MFFSFFVFFDTHQQSLYVFFFLSYTFLSFFLSFFFFFFLFVVFVVVAISWAAPATNGGSPARGRIGAVATGLRQSHSNAGSEPRLQPTPTTAHGNAGSLTH